MDIGFGSTVYPLPPVAGTTWTGPNARPRSAVPTTAAEPPRPRAESPPPAGTSALPAIVPASASYATSPRRLPSLGIVSAYSMPDSASSSIPTTPHSASSRCRTSAGAGLAADTAYDESVPLSQATYRLPPSASRAMSPAAKLTAPRATMVGFARMSSEPARV